MELDEWQDNWNELGKDDPLWVVLTDPSKKGGKWQPSEFFETGNREIKGVLSRIALLGIEIKLGSALDFGCGVGRLTQALAAHFDQVYGVDISPSMIAHANRFNREPEKCHFHVNSTTQLELFADDHFDFIYSNIALQHIEQRYSLGYVREFVRVLKPRGVAVFQLLSATLLRRLFPQFFVDAYRRLKHRGQPFIGMFGLPEREVVRAVTQAGGSVLNVERQALDWRWSSVRFFVTKP